MSSTDKKLLIPDASFPPVSVSFYYAEKDRAFCETLSHHLTPLERNGRIHMWDERQILAGQVRDQELKDHLSTDCILILLVSIDFLVSDIWERQRQMILQRHHKGDVTVIPILIRSCSLQGTGLEIIPILPQQLLSQNGFRSLTDEVWQEVAAEISQVIDAIQPWVFVASAPGDEDFVARLHHDLAPSNVRLFSDFDQHNEMDMRDIMRSTPIALLIASPLTTSSSFVIDQMNLVADYNRPVLIVWATGEDWEQPDPKSWLAETVFDARVERYETALTALVERLKRQKKRVSPLPTERFLPKEVRNPYKGLSAFTEKDARDFFGRETLIDELTGVVTQILAEDMQGQRSSRLLTVLLGASGSGKSSVVMAGLIPFLQRKGISNSKEWIYLDRMVPGKNPLRELADSLVQQPVFRNKYTGLSLQHDLATSDSLLELHHLARELVGSSSRKVVLFIDQFEEVFTSAVPEERARFFEILTAAVTEPRGPLLVLLTLRADFYDRPMQYLALYNLLEAHRVAVLPMKREDLRRIIEEPAQLPDVQLTFEGDLVGDLLFDVRDQDASLPLLQFTLEQLFLRRQGRQLTLQAYRDIGGVKGALVKHAEETYINLPSEEHQKLAQTLFGRLINAGATSQDATRRRAVLSEFELPDPRLTELLRETREAFITARLLTTNEVAGTVIVEVSHEALIREWPRCTTWIKEARENFPFQEALSKDVAQWEQLGHPKERLYRGSQLKTTRKKIDPTFLNQQEVRFLRVSAVNQRQQWIRMVAILLVPVIVLGLILTPIVVLRPSWCPSWLCPAPKVVALLAKGGIHDNNLQVTFQTVQSYFKILSVDPSAYTLGTPTPDDAQLIDTNQSLPYHVVLKIHSLQLGRYGLAIDQVGLLINKQTQQIPYPLRVVLRTDTYTYDNNLYRVTYRGQEPGAQLSALYMPVPLGFVSLVPGETDEISLEVRSTVVVDLRFQVQVIYHVIGDLASHTLLLPNMFEIVFSDPANWHPYQIQSGHLVATS